MLSHNLPIITDICDITHIRYDLSDFDKDSLPGSYLDNGSNAFYMAYLKACGRLSHSIDAFILRYFAFIYIIKNAITYSILTFFKGLLRLQLLYQDIYSVRWSEAQ